MVCQGQGQLLTCTVSMEAKELALAHQDIPAMCMMYGRGGKENCTCYVFVSPLIGFASLVLCHQFACVFYSFPQPFKQKYICVYKHYATCGLCGARVF